MSHLLTVPFCTKILCLTVLTLTLTTPDTQDERHLDLWQVHEVLGNVNGDLVQESWGDVEAILDVVEGPGCIAQVLSGAQHGVLCAVLVALEQGVHHSSGAGDVLLQGTNNTDG